MSSAFICDTLCIVFFTQILFNCIDVNIYWLFLELNVAFYYLCLGFVKTVVNDSISQRIKCIFITAHQKFVNVTKTFTASCILIFTIVSAEGILKIISM